MSGSILDTLHILSHLVLTAALCGTFCYKTNFIGAEIEAQRTEVICLGWEAVSSFPVELDIRTRGKDEGERGVIGNSWVLAFATGWNMGPFIGLRSLRRGPGLGKEFNFSLVLKMINLRYF